MTLPDGVDRALAARSTPILLSRAAFMRHGRQLDAEIPNARWLVCDEQGAVHAADGSSADPAEAQIAWATVDLYESSAIRHFFTHVRAAPALVWLQSAAAGTEGRTYAQLKGRGVRLATSHASSIPIAEFVIRAVLDCFQDAARWRDAASRREWRRHDFREVHGSRWLIVGLGHIGSAVASRALALGARVAGVRRSTGAVAGVEPVALDELRDRLPAADVVVLSLPLTPATRHTVDAEFLARMRTDSVLVNVGRGGLVDETALYGALDSGRPGWAVLDAFEHEPLQPDDPLWSHARVVVTPHAAGMGVGRYSRAADLFIENFHRWQAGQPLVHEVADPEWALAAPPSGAPD